MTNPLFNLPLSDESGPFQTCRTQHNAWTATVVQHEQEIDQMLTLLSGLPDIQNYRTLGRRATDYFGELSRLKSHFQRLRLDTICGLPCTNADTRSCVKPQLGLYTTLAIDSHLRSLTESFEHVKSGCYQFLSVLVTLNLL